MIWIIIQGWNTMNSSFILRWAFCRFHLLRLLRPLHQFIPLLPIYQFSLVLPTAQSASYSRISRTIKLSLHNYKYTSSFLLDRVIFYSTNATSLRCKINELLLVSLTSKPHIVAVTETWFAESSSVNINGFNVYRRDRASPAGGMSLVRNLDLQ